VAYLTGGQLDFVLLVGWFRRKAEDRSLTRTDTYPSYGSPLQVGDVDPTEALRIADAYACVRCLADSAASLPLIAYHRLPDGGRERFSGRLADLIANPAPATTTANLIGTLVAHLNLHGDAFLGKYRDENDVVSQIAPLDPTSISVKVKAGQPRYTRMSVRGVAELGPEDVLHIRAMSVDGVTGLSPIAQARQALGLAQSLGKHADNVARNAGRPSGMLRIPGWRTSQPDAAARGAAARAACRDVSIRRRWQHDGSANRDQTGHGGLARGYFEPVVEPSEPVRPHSAHTSWD
jgi:phage portal protein BeeE